MMEKQYLKLAEEVSAEIKEVLLKVNPAELETLYEEITKAGKIFIIAAGRTFLSLQCTAMRLAHLGFNTSIVGSVTAKPISAGDLLIAASASGKSRLPLEVATIAKEHKARVGLITSSPKSTIKSIADFSVRLPSTMKTNTSERVKSIQPMSTLFDQSLHIFGDILCRLIQERKGIKDSELRTRHTNLE